MIVEVGALQLLHRQGELALRRCDYYRDGGSFGAVFMGRTGRVSVWLQVGPWDHPSEKHYLNLYVSNGGRPERRSFQLESGGLEERQWVDAMSSANTSRARSESRENWASMLDVLRARHP